MQCLKSEGRLPLPYGGDDVQDRLTGGSAKHSLGQLQCDRAPYRGQLIQQRLGVAQGPGCLAGYQSERIFLHIQALLLGDLPEAAEYEVERDPAELVPLAAREDSRRDL